MRDSFNFNMLPIVQDNMNYNITAGVRTLTNISSNTYYGYQPPLMDKQKEEAPTEVHVQPCCVEFMDVQFESLPKNQMVNRKRSWEFNNDFREFKKRRENEYNPFVYQQSATTPNRDVIKLRKPTHNIPDMPRCIMEKINDNAQKKNDDIQELFEELLKETHGCNIYHWQIDNNL